MKLKIIIISMFTLTKLGTYAQLKMPGSVPSYSTINPRAFVDVPSPIASSLGQYGNENVSLFTGTPNITIPLYTLNVRGVCLPITLDYDAQGVRPNSLPSWAGQNWTLNVGGVITRTVKGRYDEWKYPRQVVNELPHTPKNYFECHNKLNEYIDSNGQFGNVKDNPYDDFKDIIVSYEYDLSPDEYSFNFMGKSGKFYLDKDGSWRVMSKENLEVIFDYTNPNNFITPLFAKYPYQYAIDDPCKTIAGFVIRDTDGISYTFGYNINAIDFTTDIYHMTNQEMNECWHAASWYLTKIADKYGNELYNFQYERGVYVIQAFNSLFNEYIDEDASGFLGGGGAWTSDNNSFPFSFSISSPVYLKQINALNGITVTFSSTYVGDNLATGTMYKSLYNLGYGVQTYYEEMVKAATGFYYDGRQDPFGFFYYLQATSPNAPDSLQKFRYSCSDNRDILNKARIKRLNNIIITRGNQDSGQYVGYSLCLSETGCRLKLDSIMIQNHTVNYASDSGTSEVYRFKYNRFEELPSDYLTRCTDHWGYYNGRPFEFCGAQEVSDANKVNKVTASRNPDFYYAKIGSLKEIVYPTGGVTEFKYEPNDYSLVLNDTRQETIAKSGIGGGLRIKSIKSYDSVNKQKLLLKKEYSYIDPNTNKSSGELFAEPVYCWDKYTKCYNPDAVIHLQMVHCASIVPMVNASGVGLGYSCVIENITDNTEFPQTVSKHIYRFSNISDPSVRDQRFLFTYGDVNQNTPYDEWSELGFKKGLLLSEEIYEGENIVKKINYKYRNDNYLNRYVLTSNFVSECKGYSAQFFHILGGVYKLYYPKYDLIEKTEMDYTSGTSTPMTTTYTFNKSDITFDSFIPYKHQVDLRIVDSESILRGESYEKNSYIFGDFNASGGNDSTLYKGMSYIKPHTIKYERNGKLISEEKTIYSTWKVNGNYKLLPKMITRTNHNNVTDTIISYYSYSNTGMPLYFKEIGKPAMYIKWGFNDCYVMIVSNTYIPISINDSSFLDQQTCLSYMSSYIKGYQYGHITGYIWDPLFGVKAIIKPNYGADTYNYDTIGRLIGVYGNDGKPLQKYQYNYRK